MKKEFNSFKEFKEVPSGVKCLFWIKLEQPTTIVRYSDSQTTLPIIDDIIENNTDGKIIYTSSFSLSYSNIIKIQIVNEEL